MKVTHGVRVATLLALVTLGTGCGAVYAQGPRNYPSYPNYPSSRGRVYQDRALVQGYDDGYHRGEVDGRNGNRYDVRSEREYRSAERGYDRRYGSRGDYARNYRTGFERGYSEGFRDGQYSRRNRGWGRWP